MDSPSLSVGALLSPSSAVPPAAQAATTMDTTEQSSSAASPQGQEHIQLSSQIPVTSSAASSGSAGNGNHGSLAAATAAGPATGGGTPTPTAATVAGSAVKKKKEGAGGPPKSKAYANPLASRADEIKYRTKYKQLRGKVKEIEEENAKMQAKILKTKRQIQRLRLERSILYDRFQEAKNAGTLENTSIPASSLQVQFSAVPYGSLNGSSSSMHHPTHQQGHAIQSHQIPQQSPSFHPSLSQGYHPSQFINHPGLMHDSNDTLMMSPLHHHHDIRGVDPTISMSL